MLAPKLRFLVDHCCPASIARALDAAGHEVILLREVLPTDSKDPIVAETARELGAVIVTCDKDFGGKRYEAVSRITFTRCKPQDMANRIELALSLIVYEWERVGGLKSGRVAIEVTGTFIKTIR